VLAAFVTSGCHYEKPCDYAACFETPAPVSRLELHGKCGERIWGVESNGKAGISNVTLGVVPSGYRQTFPIAGRPRSLRKGECVVLLWRSGDSFTRHWGRAASESAVHYGVWMSQPIQAEGDNQFAPGGENEPKQNDCPACAV
jgi:hypothetical protein